MFELRVVVYLTAAAAVRLSLRQLLVGAVSTASTEANVID